MPPSDLYQFLQVIRARPGLYVLDQSLQQLETMLHGYCSALDVHDVDEFGVGFNARFRRHLRHRFSWSTSAGWAAAIVEHSENQSDAFGHFYRLLDDFKRVRDAERGLNPSLQVALRMARGGPSNQDRAICLGIDGVLKCIVADGAGGLAGGEEAAQMFVDFMASRHIANEREAANAIAVIDGIMATRAEFGETTGVIACFAEDRMFGASVGDSAALLITETNVDRLTEFQVRKPLIGSGAVTPKPFLRTNASGRLLLATDGLVNYVPQSRVVDLVRGHGVARSADELVAAARLPSGVLQDDIALVLMHIA